MRIFISYLREQAANVDRLATALRACEADIWIDRSDIKALEPITEAVRQGIANSHLFLAWWFDGVDEAGTRRRYDESDACRWELITALGHCAAEGTHALASRVFIAGPQDVLSRPEVGRLKATACPKLADSPTDAEIRALAQALIAQGGKVTAPFGAAHAVGAGRPLPNTIPPQVNFVGRSRELLDLHGALWGGGVGHAGDGATCCVVAGMGGQGKTALLFEYARRFRSLYPGGVELIRLDGDAGITDADNPGGQIDAMIDAALRRAALDKNLQFGQGSRADLRTALIRHFSVGMDAETPSDKSYPAYLWLVDDVPSKIDRNQAMALRAPTDRGATLMSSRAAVPGLSAHKLGHLAPADARALLTKTAEGRLDPAVAEQLIQKVHCHALSVRLIGAALKNRQKPDLFLAPTSPGLLEGLEAACANMPAILGRDPDLKPIIACLQTSLTLLPAGGAGRKLLALLAALAPAPVPEPLAEAGLADEYPRAMDAVQALGLVDCHDDGDIPCLSLHPLLAEVVLALPDYVPDGQGARLEAVDELLLADMRAIIKDAGHFRRDKRAPLLLPHARHRALIGLAADQHLLAGEYGSACYLLGNLSEARALEEEALAVRRRVLGPEHPDTLISMNNLASMLKAQGDYAGARALEEAVLEVSRRVLGPEHPDTLRSMNNLALTLWAQGDYAAARKLHEEVLPLRRRVLGPEHPDTLTSMNNLAHTLWAQGDYAGARALQEAVLAVRRRVLGPEHPDTLGSMNNLAATLLAQGDYAGARALQEAVLAVSRRVQGPEHPNTLTSMNNLAGTLGAQGDHAGARALQEAVLAVSRRVLGPEHPDTLRSMNNLAETLRMQRHHAEARALQEEALAVSRRVQGPEHPHTLGSMNNFALTLGAQGDYAEARELHAEVLAVRRRVLGPEHLDTLTSMNNLALTLGAQGDHAGARALEEEALAVRRRVQGPEHPDTLTSMNNLALTLWAQGDYAGARALEDEALAVRRRVLGPEHPATLTSMGNLASMLKAQGDHAGARALEEEALAVRRRVLGPEHPDTLTSMNNLALTLWAQGDYAGARKLLKEALAVRRRVLGPEHPNTLISARNLAVTLYAHTTADAEIEAQIKPYLAAGLACEEAQVRAAWEELADHLGWR